MKKISVILPCKNEAKNLPLLLSEIVKNIAKRYDYEVIIVDDGSDDDTLKVIKRLCSKRKNIKGIKLSKSSGQQVALMAGIRQSAGDAVITMDADFQHPPEMLPKIIKSWEKGHDLVLLQDKDYLRSQRRSKVTTFMGYIVWRWVTNGFLLPGVSEFRLMDRKVVEYLLTSSENEYFLRGLVNLAAVNPAILAYKVGKRAHGKSEYSLWNSLDVFINGIVSFSTKPLRLTAILGLIIFLSSFGFLLLDVIVALVLHRDIVSGYLTIVFLITFLNGFIFFYLGILGEYIGVIFREIKKRPRYTIEEKINFK